METYQKDTGTSIKELLLAKWGRLSLQKNNDYNQSNHTELYNIS